MTKLAPAIGTMSPLLTSTGAAERRTEHVTTASDARASAMDNLPAFPGIPADGGEGRVGPMETSLLMMRCNNTAQSPSRDRPV
jgi:hypothetical protein